MTPSHARKSPAPTGLIQNNTQRQFTPSTSPAQVPAPKTRGQAINAMCKSCIHDDANGGTWREQVATCTSTDCPLWRFRPVQDGKSCPAWIKSHDPDDLPEGWLDLDQVEAVRAMRSDIADKVNGRAVQADGGPCAPSPVLPQRVGTSGAGGDA